ncbi:MAG: methylmalonyl Co-A mutase-associated GTPase MeaB [Chloroflexi bacterium]|nr:methylmalonyl Co-A mutase-associated GTPase MeaB [Chloroflexota bacterium]MCL5274822.1 methylmalonyl Co-A mutase-associated GTPase MeaB [Chloroflexota bacterium]
MEHPLTRRELARLITRIENGERGAQDALNALYPHSGRARIIGVTGAPGSGKSTLVAEMTRVLREQANPPRVAIVAVDPSSPFSGGAILGDRIRMRDLYGDPGVFIRSMASRGALGGIAAATADVVTVLDAGGFEVILIETVGAGQLEVDVARIAQTVIVVEAPGAGDEVQAVKAGILEIADIIVVNKADREGVAQTVSALKMALDIAPAGAGHHGAQADNEPVQSDAYHWQAPILKVSALNREGIPDVLAALQHHAEMLAASGEGERRRRKRVEADIQARLRELLLQHALHALTNSDYQRVLAAADQRTLHPAEAARRLLQSLNL